MKDETEIFGIGILKKKISGLADEELIEAGEVVVIMAKRNFLIGGLHYGILPFEHKHPLYGNFTYHNISNECLYPPASDVHILDWISVK